MSTASSQSWWKWQVKLKIFWKLSSRSKLILFKNCCTSNQFWQNVLFTMRSGVLPPFFSREIVIHKMNLNNAFSLFLQQRLGVLSGLLCKERQLCCCYRSLWESLRGISTNIVIHLFYIMISVCYSCITSISR